MKKLLLILSIAILVFACNSNNKKATEATLDPPMYAVLTADDIPDSLQTSISQYVEEYATSNKCQFLMKVGKPGESAFYAGYDGRSNKEVTNYGTPYEIGSATKMFTATSILQLIEQNKFALEDALTEVLPNKELYKGLLVIDGKDYIDSVKVVNLLNHTSGFPEYFSDSDEEEIELHGDASLKFTPEGLIELSKTHITEPFVPGSKFQYCNVNYLLLGMIIEKYSGMTYQEYFIQNIITPLELKDTYLGTIDLPKEQVQGHYNGKETEMPPSLAGAAGEIISTFDDMEKFVNAWYGGKLFKEESTHKMLMNDYYNELAMGIKYGLGIANILEKTWGHPGQTFGIQSYAGSMPNGYCIELYLDDASVSSWEPAIVISSMLAPITK